MCGFRDILEDSLTPSRLRTHGLNLLPLVCFHIPQRPCSLGGKLTGPKSFLSIFAPGSSVPQSVPLSHRGPVLRAGSNLSPQIHSVSNVHAIFEAHPEVWHTWFLYPCRTVYFSFSRYVCFAFFAGVWVLRDPTFPAKKQEQRTLVNGSVGA